MVACVAFVGFGEFVDDYCCTRPVDPEVARTDCCDGLPKPLDKRRQDFMK